MTDTPHGKIVTTRTAQAAQDEIVRLILDSGLHPGDPVPTEAELVARLGVSRNSVREALRALQALEIVEIRHGHGTYVGQLSMKPLTDGLTFRTMQSLRDDARDIRELLEVREALEIGLIPKVLATITTADLDDLDDLVRTMETRAKSHERFPAEDRLFHQTLYRSIDNTLVQQLLTAFWDTFNRVRDELGEVNPHSTSTAQHHRAIVTALRAGDPTAAATAMNEHFRNIDASVEDMYHRRTHKRSGHQSA